MRKRQKPPAVEPMLWTARQTAEVLNVSERTLFTLTKAGKSPAVAIGERGIRYDPRDVRDWIEAAKRGRKKG